MNVVMLFAVGLDAKLSESACSIDEPAMPSVSIDGVLVERPITETHVIDGRPVHMRLLHDELQMTYVHGLISPLEIDELVRLADARGGFIRSPVKTQGDGDDRAADKRRNSTSCPMLWPLVYGGEHMRAKLAAAQPSLLDELKLVENISTRVASLFSAAGMPLSSLSIEPLQLVRYRDQAFFGPHHDCAPPHSHQPARA